MTTEQTDKVDSRLQWSGDPEYMNVVKAYYDTQVCIIKEHRTMYGPMYEWSVSNHHNMQVMGTEMELQDAVWKVHYSLHKTSNTPLVERVKQFEREYHD